MQSGTSGGLPWWLWLTIAVCCLVAVVVGRRRATAAKRRDGAEALAQRAETTHDSAVTRHEGGA